MDPSIGKRYCHEALFFTDGIGIMSMPLEWTALWLYLHLPLENQNMKTDLRCFRIKDVFLNMHLFISAVAI